MYFRERDLRELIGLHAVAPDSDVGRLEAQGALNFLALDDLSIAQEGEPIHPKSIVPSERANTLPHFEATPNDGFLRDLQASGEKWIVLVDRSGEPGLVIDTDGFLRGTLLEGAAFSAARHCHRPLVVRDPATRLGHLLHRLRVDPSTSEDDVIDRDVILLWTPSEKRVLTGADILGRLLRGIATRGPISAPQSHEGALASRQARRSGGRLRAQPLRPCPLALFTVGPPQKSRPRVIPGEP